MLRIESDELLPHTKASEIYKKISDSAQKSLRGFLTCAVFNSDIIKILPKDKTYKIIEDYYEIILELLTSVMYLDGFKTLSHISVIEYFFKHYKILSSNQFSIIDTMRKYRNGIVYYGQKISADYLTNNEEEIKKIINLLQKFVENKIRSN